MKLSKKLERALQILEVADSDKEAIKQCLQELGERPIIDRGIGTEPGTDGAQQCSAYIPTMQGKKDKHEN